MENCFHFFNLLPHLLQTPFKIPVYTDHSSKKRDRLRTSLPGAKEAAVFWQADQKFLPAGSLHRKKQSLSNRTAAFFVCRFDYSRGCISLTILCSRSMSRPATSREEASAWDTG